MASLIHTCYRILDIDRSVSFYEKLGRMNTGAAAVNVFMGLKDGGPRLESTWHAGRTEPYEI